MGEGEEDCCYEMNGRKIFKGLFFLDVKIYKGNSMLMSEDSFKIVVEIVRGFR